MKLTTKQREALATMALLGRAENSYTLRVGLNTLNSLALKKLVSVSYPVGSIAMPRTAIKWWINDAGRAAIVADTP